MRRLLVTSVAVAMFVGCNVNESKEGRIRKLESQLEETAERLDQFEKRIHELESNLAGRAQ